MFFIQVFNHCKCLTIEPMKSVNKKCATEFHKVFQMDFRKKIPKDSRKTLKMDFRKKFQTYFPKIFKVYFPQFLKRFLQNTHRFTCEKYNECSHI